MRVESTRAPDAVVAARQTAQHQAIVAKLAATDQHVRSHEQAHLAAAGGYARSGASFTYTRGPDGQFYAVAGEVGIDASPVNGDPEATIRKAETIRAAALAPSDPSAQDRAVAAQAGHMEQEAQRQLAQLQEAAMLGSNQRARGYQDPAEVGAGSLVSLMV